MLRKMLPVLFFAAGSLLVAGQADGQKLYAIFVGDQSEWAGWGKFQPNISLDGSYVFAMIAGNVPHEQWEYTPYSIELDEEGSPKKILQLIQNVRPGPNDTLLFYFTGHGANDDQGHYFALAKGKLYRSEVQRSMAGARARLNVIISDCCNVRSDGRAFGAPAVRVEEPRRVTPLFQSLLFEPRGEVDINSCAPGESAFFASNDPDRIEGSLFTKSLAEYLQEMKEQRPSWDQLIRKVSLDVRADFRKEYPNGAQVTKGARSQSDQNVYAVTYPGMPKRAGPRTGLAIRDHDPSGAMIVKVQANFPGTEAYDLAANKYTSLRSGQVIVAANGKAIRDANEFVVAVKSSPPIMELVVRSAGSRDHKYLVRLRY